MGYFAIVGMEEKLMEGRKVAVPRGLYPPRPLVEVIVISFVVGQGESNRCITAG